MNTLANATTLAETSFYMSSSDYKDRFLAEKRQLEIRLSKLKTFVASIETAIDNNTPQPPHDCPLCLLKRQIDAMEAYLSILNERAVFENISC